MSFFSGLVGGLTGDQSLKGGGEGQSQAPMNQQQSMNPAISRIQASMNTNNGQMQGGQNFKGLIPLVYNHFHPANPNGAYGTATPILSSPVSGPNDPLMLNQPNMVLPMQGIGGAPQAGQQMSWHGLIPQFARLLGLGS